MSRKWVEHKVGKELDELARSCSNQDHFADVLRGLIKHLDLADEDDRPGIRTGGLRQAQDENSDPDQAEGEADGESSESGADDQAEADGMDDQTADDDSMAAESADADDET